MYLNRDKIIKSNYWDWRNIIPKDYDRTPRGERQYPDLPTFMEFMEHHMTVMVFTSQIISKVKTIKDTFRMLAETLMSTFDHFGTFVTLAI